MANPPHNKPAVDWLGPILLVADFSQLLLTIPSTSLVLLPPLLLLL